MARETKTLKPDRANTPLKTSAPPQPCKRALATPAVARSPVTNTLVEAVILPDPTKADKRLVLTEEQKRYMIGMIACYESAADVSREMQYIFGVTVSRQSQQRYDPNTVNGQSLREDLKEHFRQARREHLARCRQYGVGNQDVRLAHLDQIFHRYMDSGNLVAACQTLKQVALDVGGKYTNVKIARAKPDARQSLANILGISVDELPEKPRR